MKAIFVDKRHLGSHNSIMQALDPMSVRYPFVRLSSKMTCGLEAWKPRSCRAGLVACPLLPICMVSVSRPIGLTSAIRRNGVILGEVECLALTPDAVGIGLAPGCTPALYFFFADTTLSEAESAPGRFDLETNYWGSAVAGARHGNRLRTNDIVVAPAPD
jgi:hypothetical protein